MDRRQFAVLTVAILVLAGVLLYGIVSMNQNAERERSDAMMRTLISR